MPKEVSSTSKICLDHGTRLRYIRGMYATSTRAATLYEDLYTKDELDLIKTICEDAEQRAERKYREERQADAEARGRTSS